MGTELRYTLDPGHTRILLHTHISCAFPQKPIIIFSSGWLNNVLYYKSPLHHAYNVRAYPPNGFQRLTSRAHTPVHPRSRFSSPLLLSARHVAFIYMVARARAAIKTRFARELRMRRDIVTTV